MRRRRPDARGRRREGAVGHRRRPRGSRGSTGRGGAAIDAWLRPPRRCQASEIGRAAAFAACQRMSCSSRRSVALELGGDRHARRRSCSDDVDPAAHRPADGDLGERRPARMESRRADLAHPQPGAGRGARAGVRVGANMEVGTEGRDDPRVRLDGRIGVVAASRRDTSDASMPASRATARWLRPASSRKRRRSSARSRRIGSARRSACELELRSRASWPSTAVAPCSRLI